MPATRRQILAAASSSLVASLASLAYPRMAFARAESDNRFVFIIQRGAADGLNTVIPYADPDYARLRGPIAIDIGTATRLDTAFALHPSLTKLAQTYGRGEAMFVHAVASPYRERSHFDAQNVLESGGVSPYELKDGWMNRLAALLPASRERREKAIAFAPTVPLALRGSAPVTSYAPGALSAANDDLLMRVQQLYSHDAQLHALWSAAMDAKGMAEASGSMDGRIKGGQDSAQIGQTAASFLAAPDGPRLAMIETGGWDTHSGQLGRQAAQLKSLDNLVEALRQGLGPVWAHTVVLVATEFGRTAAVNGTGGTDHGTGSVAMVAGGLVRGGRVVADWPGLRASALYQGRDLKPTLDLDALIAQLAAETFHLEPQRVRTALFPDANRQKNLGALLNA